MLQDLSEYEDKAKQREIRHIFQDMELCGCGTGVVYGIVYSLLKLVDAGGSFYGQVGDLCDSAVEFVLHVMNSKKWGLLEHGSSIYGSWLTPKGKVLLKFFENFGDNSSEWPSWWCSCDMGEDW